MNLKNEIHGSHRVSFRKKHLILGTEKGERERSCAAEERTLGDHQTHCLGVAIKVSWMEDGSSGSAA